MELVERRSRFHRRPLGLSLHLTQRDVDVFLLLNRYRYLRAKHIHAFIGGDYVALSKRLGTLYHEGDYLGRPEQQWQAVNARYMPAVYELGALGERVLRERGYVVTEHRAEARQFRHELMVCDVLASVELGCRADPTLRFVPWPEICESPKFPQKTRDARDPVELPAAISYTFDRGATRHATKSLIPDAVFGIEYKDVGYRFFALEADRNHEPVFRNNLEQTSYLRKFLQYQAIFKDAAYKTTWGVPNLLVLNVTINAEHCRNIIRLFSELTEGKGAGYFLFKTTPSLGSYERAPKPDADMLAGPWERLGHPPIDISKP